jgi:hypothetical protein
MSFQPWAYRKAPWGIDVTLTVSATGDVIDAKPSSTDGIRYWAQIKPRVFAWKFVPFQKRGKPVVALVQEYIDLAPPERLPVVRAPGPVIRPESKIVIELDRGTYYGTRSAYSVTLSSGGAVWMQTFIRWSRSMSHP